MKPHIGNIFVSSTIYIAIVSVCTSQSCLQITFITHNHLAPFKITHWQSPYMHAYFPALNSFPSLLGDMLADAINCLGFTWVSAHSLPVCEKLGT